MLPYVKIMRYSQYKAIQQKNTDLALENLKLKSRNETLNLEIEWLKAERNHLLGDLKRKEIGD
jgi:uncharacterized protein YhdP